MPSRSRGQAEAVEYQLPFLPSTDGVYDIGGLVPVWAVVVIVGTAVAAVTFFATSNSEPPRFHWVRIPSLQGGARGQWNLPGGRAVRAPGADRPGIPFCNLKPLWRVLFLFEVFFFFSFGNKFILLRYNSHTIEFPYLKCGFPWFFIIFTDLCPYYHYQSQSISRPTPISSHFLPF